MVSPDRASPTSPVFVAWQPQLVETREFSRVFLMLKPRTIVNPTLFA